MAAKINTLFAWNCFLVTDMGTLWATFIVMANPSFHVLWAAAIAFKLLSSEYAVVHCRDFPAYPHHRAACFIISAVDVVLMVVNWIILPPQQFYYSTRYLSSMTRGFQLHYTYEFCGSGSCKFNGYEIWNFFSYLIPHYSNWMIYVSTTTQLLKHWSYMDNGYLYQVFAI